LLENNVGIIDDKMIKFFSQEVPFIKLKVKKTWNLESEQRFKQLLCYEISSQCIELTFENFPPPSNELIKSVCEALNTEDPYDKLETIFNEYGHLLCKKVVLGGKLTDLRHLSLNGNYLGHFPG